jgi:hypothetical protein
MHWPVAFGIGDLIRRLSVVAGQVGSLPEARARPGRMTCVTIPNHPSRNQEARRGDQKL